MNKKRTLVTRLQRKCLDAYIAQARWIWNHLPHSLHDNALGRAYARYLDRVVRICSERRQFVATFFLRNRPELQLVTRFLEDRPIGSRVNISVMACSKGAEVYSLVWAIRSARPDLELNLSALDISQEIVEFAKDGIYSLEGEDSSRSKPDKIAPSNQRVERGTSKDQNAWIFERMTSDEMRAMFDIKGGLATVRPYWKRGISWHCGDAGDPQLRTLLGPQDIVVANRFLCHMQPQAAADCLRNIAQLVRPGGYLFVSGIDLDVRTRVALQMKWLPVVDLIREIHEGDDSIRRGWPTEYWGLEPFNSRRPDWAIRYASVFQVSNVGCAESEKHPTFEQVES
jgi:chemotaxis methyl-accepting protein methylase